MIQKFKKKTTWILMLILWGILFGILGTVNILNRQSNMTQTKRLLMQQAKILQKDEASNLLPPIVDGKELSRIYSVAKSEDDEYTVLFCPESQRSQENELIKVAQKIMELGHSDGIIENIRYTVTKTSNQTLVSFLDYSIWRRQQVWMLFYSAVIAVILGALLSMAAVALCRWLTKPVEDAFNKQKQFISDAGHELKTPLTIIKSSLDMLENNDNKYIEYIRNETDRMTELTYDLLYLSSIDNQESIDSYKMTDLGHCVEGAILPMEVTIYEKGFVLETEFESSVMVNADEKQIRKLTDILLDNAMKHANANGIIRVVVIKEKERPVIQVSNQGVEIPVSERQRIFDRFYRGDKSRERSDERYGLGLAIARQIAINHKAEIMVDCNDGVTSFRVMFNA